MGSMNNNNWLGFSLSPHDQAHDHSQNLGFNSSDQEISAIQDDVSGHQCFDLTSADSTIPSLNLPPTPNFGILELAFNRPNTTQSQDWNMNSFSCSSQNQETPKLENFLGVGGHSFTDNNNHHEHKNLCNNPITNTTHDYQTNGGNHNPYTASIYQEAAAAHESTSHTTNTTTMGLSMIKNWLRNNPAPPHEAENKVGSEVSPPQGPVAGEQTLSLSMSTGSQSSDNSKLQQCNGTNSTTTTTAVESQSTGAIESVPRKSIDTFGQRTSIYRGVTRHRWTGRYEAHLWDNSCRREGQTRKGRQVYLGGYDKEEKAARAYDLAALKYWGSTTTTNFPVSNYEKEIEEMKHMTRQEYVASLRRKSSGFSRGASIYRGVTRHHQHGRWQARIGRVAGNKDLYLGTFSTQEEAAEAYDIAAIKFRGLNAVTNFEINRYDVKCILESATLPIGGAAKRLKDAEINAENLALEMHRANEAAANNLNLHLTAAGINSTSSSNCWPTIAFQLQPQPPAITNNMIYSPNYQGSLWYCKQEQQDINPPDHINIGSSSSLINHDHINHLQLGSATQNNFLLHNLMSSLDSSSSSNVYATNGMMPLVGAAENQVLHGFVMGNDHQHHQQHNEEKQIGYGYDHQERIYGNLYNYHHHHQSQQSSSPISNGSANWNNNIPTGVPTNPLAVCHGASTFTVWNDT